MNGADGRDGSPRGPIVLLAGQGFALGLTTAWILIPASAIFLAEYGSDLLPVTYIGAAVAGVVSSTVLAAAFRRRPLASVATITLGGLATALVASWVLLSTSDADWVSFALLVLMPIIVPVGFIFVVGQAGMLLDVRALKAFYARVVAGFALGFVTGGLAGPLLLSLLGSTESVLAAAAVAAGLFLTLVETTRRRYPAQLAVVEHAGAETERPTLRGLARNRYVMLIVAFQMLSAVESQWLDFHVLESASRRYESSDALARFLSQFAAIAYGTDILFLLLLAGFLLRRFGLRYGLTANALGVLLLVVAIIIATSLLGSAATVVFVLIVAARVTDLTFSDGTSRTSLSAAYQALPTRIRSVSQAAVEGLAVPVAIGASGVVLLVVQSVGGTEGVLLPVLTSIVVTAWVVVAVLLYREYRTNLLANLRGRALDPSDLTVDDESTLVVVNRLIESEDERDVRLGLDILTVAEHPELPVRLQQLVMDARESVRTEALERLLDAAPHAAAAAARTGLDDPYFGVRAASVRALGAGGHPSDLAGITARSADAAPEVRVAVAFALSRMGDDGIRVQVANEIERLSRSDVPQDRTVAALMLGEVEPGPWMDRAALRALLADPDPDVVNAALAAIRRPDDSELIPGVASYLYNRRTAGAAVDALVRAGDAALVVIEDGLRSNEQGRRTQELLVRASREIGTPASIAVLHRHVDHRDREVGLAVMRALAVLGPPNAGAALPADDPARIPIDPGNDPGTIGADPDRSASVVSEDLERAAHALRALVAFDNVAAASLLNGALRDELELIRQRVLAAFAMRHGTEGLNRVVFQLAQRDPRFEALALEWLDVTLTGTERAAVALLEPRLSDRERLNAFQRTFPLPTIDQHAVLLDLVEDRDDRWRRPWIKACALYTTAAGSDDELDAIIAATLESLNLVDGEELIVNETLAVIRQRRLDPV